MAALDQVTAEAGEVRFRPSDGRGVSVNEVSNAHAIVVATATGVVAWDVGRPWTSLPSRYNNARTLHQRRRE